MQRSLILERILNEFELSHNATAETTKNICCGEDKDAVDHSTVTRGFKKFWSICKNLDPLAR